jgi:hypothetical protein
MKLVILSLLVSLLSQAQSWAYDNLESYDFQEAPVVDEYIPEDYDSITHQELMEPQREEDIYYDRADEEMLEDPYPDSFAESEEYFE